MRKGGAMSKIVIIEYTDPLGNKKNLEVECHDSDLTSNGKPLPLDENYVGIFEDADFSGCWSIP